jgi:hypothetical protein
VKSNSYEFEQRVRGLLKPHAGAFFAREINERFGLYAEPGMTNARSVLRQVLRRMVRDGIITAHEAYDPQSRRFSLRYEKVFKRERDAEAVSA